jgi:hypothetical protein
MFVQFLRTEFGVGPDLERIKPMPSEWPTPEERCGCEECSKVYCEGKSYRIHNLASCCVAKIREAERDALAHAERAFIADGLGGFRDMLKERGHAE